MLEKDQQLELYGYFLYKEQNMGKLYQNIEENFVIMLGLVGMFQRLIAYKQSYQSTLLVPTSSYIEDPCLGIYMGQQTTTEQIIRTSYWKIN